MQLFLVIVCISISYCSCYEWKKDVISCNITYDCEIYSNICQITTCQNGYCSFTEDIYEEGCCTNESNCNTQDCKEASCVNNICEYEDVDCSSNRNIIGIIFGIILLLCLLIAFLSILVLLIIRTILDKKQNTKITSIPQNEQMNIQKYNPNKDIIVGKCALCSF